MVNSGKLIEWPHVFRTGSPFLYLLSISFFLLGRAYLANKNKPELLDIVLLSIPLLHTIELLPFFIKSDSEKIKFIEIFIYQTGGIYTTNTGPIPSNSHYIAQGFFGLLGSGIILIKTGHIAFKEHNNVFKFRWTWLFSISLSLFVFFSVAVFGYLIIKIDRHFFQYFISIYFAITLILLLFFLFLQPHAVYGVSSNKHQLKNNNETQKPKPLDLNSNEIETIKSDIDLFFKNNQAYLSTDFRLQDFAEEINMNKNLASQVINRIYNQNFNQLVNSKRIDYVLEKLSDVQWAKLSLEGMANTVGFKSRTTFNKAFKEKTKLTPSEYISKIRN